MAKNGDDNEFQYIWRKYRIRRTDIGDFINNLLYLGDNLKVWRVQNTFNAIIFTSILNYYQVMDKKKSHVHSYMILFPQEADFKLSLFNTEENIEGGERKEKVNRYAYQL